MEIKNLDLILVPADRKVNPAALVGKRLEDVELADLITVAATTKTTGPIVAMTIREEPTDDGHQQYL